MPWMNGAFPPKSNSFDYRVSRGEGHSLGEARRDAFHSLLIDLGNMAGVSVNSRTLTEIKRNLNYRNRDTYYNESERSTTAYRIEREGFKASFLKVSEYYEYETTAAGTIYRVWELYEVSSRRSFTPYIPEYTDRYGASAAWRSALLPGWGQMHKGSMTKGLLVIGGEVALIGGIVATENLRAGYMQKINQTHNATHIRTYAAKAGNMSNIRNLCITGAAALYIYNVIDAIVAPGDHYLLLRDKRFSFTPTTADAYAGIALVINF
jgi:aspartate 1-decarboxylase